MVLVGACLNPVVDPPLSYAVRFDPNGGVGALDAPYELVPQFTLALVGDRVTLPGPGTITCPPDLFLGWNTRPSGGGTRYAPGDTMTMPSRDVTLYAQWSAVPVFNVTYDANGGVDPPIDGTPYLDGALVNILGPGTMTRVGYQFANWNTANDGSGTTYNPIDIYTIVAASVTFHAQWTQLFEVTFVSNGGSVVGPQVVPNGGWAADPGAPIRAGYTFNGWFTDDGTFTNQWVFASHTITSNTILYASWTAETFTLTYEGNGAGGTPPPSGVYNVGNDAEVAGKASLELLQDGISFGFTGWNTDPAGVGTAYQELDVIPMTSNLTLWAQWNAIGSSGPAGGIVFYDKGFYSDGWRYMEAAPVDQSTSAEWGGLGTLVNSFATAIGSGPSNTTMITGVLGIGGYAAYVAQMYELNGFSDWFLPSRLELEQLYANRAVVGGFSVDGYWASSEADATYALFLAFNNGVVYSDAKNLLKSVRAVRRF